MSIMSIDTLLVYYKYPDPHTYPLRYGEDGETRGRPRIPYGGSSRTFEGMWIPTYE